MKKCLLSASVVLGIVLVLPTVMGQTSPTDTNWTTGTSVKIYAGSKFSGTSESSYTQSDVLDVNADSEGSTAGVATNDLSKLFNLKNITVTGSEKSSNDELFGFLAVDTDTFSEMFTGSIQGNANLTVKNTSTGSAYGAFFREFKNTPAAWMDINITDASNSIIFGTINVTNQDATSGTGVAGFVAGGLTSGKVTVDNIMGTSKRGWALGVQLNGIKGQGTLTILDKVDVAGDTEAIAMRMDNNIVGAINVGQIGQSTDALKATATGGDAFGIRVSVPANATELATLGGSTTINGNIRVESQANNGTASGIGVSGAVKGNVTVNGDIFATSKYNAAGFASLYGGLDSGKKVQLGNITAKSTGTAVTDANKENTAVGVRFSSGVTGTVETGDITVDSTGVAYGVHISDSDSNLSTTAGLSNGTFGKIDVTSTRTIPMGTAPSTNPPTAAGIWTAGDSTFTLTKDVDVKAAKSSTDDTIAYGVVIENSTGNITIANDLTISAKGANVNTGIGADKLNLTLGLAQCKANLTTDSVRVTDLSIDGNGRANIAVVNATNTVLDDNAVLAVDGVKMAEEEGNLGTVDFQNKQSRLEISGNVGTIENIGKLQTTGEMNQIINLASLTNWTVNESGNIVSLGSRDVACFNDNYLAASQIHNKYTGLNAVRDHVISGAVVSRPLHGYYGQSPCPNCYTFYSCPKHKSRAAWANYVGRDSQYRSSHNRRDWDFSSNGIQVGTDIIRTCQDQYGIFAGFEDTNGSNYNLYNQHDRLDAQDYYVGIYGVHVFRNAVDLRVVFNYGWQDFDTSRYASATDLHTMSFTGNTAELNVELGKRRYFGPWSARPVVALDWYWTGLDYAQESEGNDSREQMTYDGTDISQLYFRFGTDLRYEWNRRAYEGGLYYSYDMLGETLKSGVSSYVDPNYLQSTLVGSKLGRSVLSYNLGGSWTICSNFAMFGGYRGEVAPERSGDGVAHTGYVGGTFRW